MFSKAELIVTLQLANLKDQICTIGDLRDFLESAEALQIPHDTPLVDCTVTVDVSFPLDSVSPITCGEHAYDHPNPNSAIINMCGCTRKELEQEVTQ
jgi:hypothetical protein